MAKFHQFNPNMLPDDEFVPGNLEFLVPGNAGRLLDGRRTQGKLLEIDEESAMFKWQILEFEDKGKQWDLPAEDIVRFQFNRQAQRLAKFEVSKLAKRIHDFQDELVIRGKPPVRAVEIEETQEAANAWLVSNSRFFDDAPKLNLNSRIGPPVLATDLMRYMQDYGLDDLEKRTAENVVLNPSSGEWVKGMEIVLAQMGLADFQGKVTRTKDVFSGMGEKSKRERYLIHRLAFMRAYLRKLSLEELVLYRGASTEKAWQPRPKTLRSYTFSLRVARSFAKFDRTSRFRHASLSKDTFPVDRVFMTYLETAAMNRQYAEAEAMILEFHS